MAICSSPKLRRESPAAWPRWPGCRWLLCDCRRPSPPPHRLQAAAEGSAVVLSLPGDITIRAAVGLVDLADSSGTLLSLGGCRAPHCQRRPPPARCACSNAQAAQLGSLDPLAWGAWPTCPEAWASPLRAPRGPRAWPGRRARGTWAGAARGQQQSQAKAGAPAH